MAKIRAIIKRPDEKYGHVTNISPTLENLQKTVGGYIEPVSFDGWVILCNENGKNEGLPYNMRLGNVDVLVGTIVVLGTEGEEFTDCPVDFKVWKKIVDRWRADMSFSELQELGIDCYPDNDGGLWYWNNGSTETVEEDMSTDEP